jgi:hypothetical protein
MAKEPGDPKPGMCKACGRHKIHKGLTRLCYRCYKSGGHGRTDDAYIYFDASGLCSKEQERQEERGERK